MFFYLPSFVFKQSDFYDLIFSVRNPENAIKVLVPRRRGLKLGCRTNQAMFLYQSRFCYNASLFTNLSIVVGLALRNQVVHSGCDIDLLISFTH